MSVDSASRDCSAGFAVSARTARRMLSMSRTPESSQRSPLFAVDRASLLREQFEACGSLMRVRCVSRVGRSSAPPASRLLCKPPIRNHETTAALPPSATGPPVHCHRPRLFATQPVPQNLGTCPGRTRPRTAGRGARIGHIHPWFPPTTTAS